MPEDYLTRVQKKRQELAASKAQQEQQRASQKTSTESTQSVVQAMYKQGAKSRTTTQPVEIKNDNLAKTGDIQSVVDSINKLNVTAFVATHDKYTEMAQKMEKLCGELESLAGKISSNGQNLDKTLSGAIKQVGVISEKLTKANLSTSDDIQKSLQELVTEVKNIEVSPQIDVKAPEVVVQPQEPVDLSPLTDVLTRVEKAVKAQKVDIPVTDLSGVEQAVEAVKSTIEGLTFPVPNYVLPFKDTDGKAVQAQLDANGNIPTSQTGLTPGTDFDYIDIQQTSGTVETYVYKDGGSGGTTVQTITVTYTDATKADLNTVEYS